MIIEPVVENYRHSDLLLVECSRCKCRRNIRYYSYTCNLLKNSGKYVCHRCKTAGERVELVCKYCNKIFHLDGGYYRFHNRRQFCAIECSHAYQQKLYADMRKKGKKCSRCGRVKSVDEFCKSAVGKKNPRSNKIYQYCHTCKAKYRMLYSNRIKMRAVKYLGGKCVVCGIEAGTVLPALHPIAFDFHHRDPSIKEFNITKCGKKWEQLKLELNKCDLLCAICHRKKHLVADNWEDYNTVKLPVKRLTEAEQNPDLQ